MDKAQAIQRFWNSFEVPAYDENTVPSTAGYPRLTYEYSESGFDEPVILTASLWYMSTSWADITLKAHEISQYIGTGGCLEPCDFGAIWINRSTPFAQRMGDPDGNLRRMLITVVAEYLTTD